MYWQVTCMLKCYIQYIKCKIYKLILYWNSKEDNSKLVWIYLVI